MICVLVILVVMAFTAGAATLPFLGRCSSLATFFFTAMLELLL